MNYFVRLLQSLLYTIYRSLMLKLKRDEKKGTEDVITTTTDGSTTKPAQPKESNESQQK